MQQFGMLSKSFRRGCLTAPLFMVCKGGKLKVKARINKMKIEH